MAIGLIDAKLTHLCLGVDLGFVRLKAFENCQEFAAPSAAGSASAYNAGCPTTTESTGVPSTAGHSIAVATPAA